MSNTPDPLTPLLTLDGVADAARTAADDIAAVHRHRANLRGWNITGAESALRGARASALLDGAGWDLAPEQDPILAGAIRAAAVVDPAGADATVATWRRAPLQVLARVNTLAAPSSGVEAAGRPRPEVAQRLQLLAGLVTGGTGVPAAVLSAVVHGEIAALAPFERANGVTARVASRIVTVAGGLDPRGLGVPEVWWSRDRDRYAELVEGFASGRPEGVRAWLLFHMEGLVRGAREARSIADAKG